MIFNIKISTMLFLRAQRLTQSFSALSHTLQVARLSQTASTNHLSPAPANQLIPAPANQLSQILHLTQASQVPAVVEVTPPRVPTVVEVSPPQAPVVPQNSTPNWKSGRVRTPLDPYSVREYPGIPDYYYHDRFGYVYENRWMPVYEHYIATFYEHVATAITYGISSSVLLGGCYGLWNLAEYTHPALRFAGILLGIPGAVVGTIAAVHTLYAIGYAPFYLICLAARGPK